MNLQEDRLVTTRELADLLGITDTTLRMWRMQRRGPAWFRLGTRGRVRYDLARVRAWLEENETTKW